MVDRSSEDRIYLDFAATAPTAPRAVDAMRNALDACRGNPASQHAEGRRARREIDEDLQRIAQTLGADVESHGGERLIQTSGGTEANNLALFGLVRQPSGHLIVSAIEHPSVLDAARELARRGCRVDYVSVDDQGVVRLEELVERITDKTALVSLMWGNNETGVLQPIAEAADICRAHGVPLHCDAVQAAGKVPIGFRKAGLSAMSLSAHKLGGPAGVGGLLLAPGFEPAAMFYGGMQQLGTRPGTQSVALVAGMRWAYEHWETHRDAYAERLEALRDRFEAGLRQELPNIVVHSGRSARLPHISCISFPGYDRQAFQMALDLAGVACSTGSACSSGSSEPSHVLVAMGLSRGLWDSALRFGFGPPTSDAEVDAAVRRIIRVYSNLRVTISG